VVDANAVTIFDYVHEIPRAVEFVNGGYELVAIKTRTIAGRDILYCLGEARLNNSCCGETRLCYALVIGDGGDIHGQLLHSAATLKTA
jgi:hypothetical protein